MGRPLVERVIVKIGSSSLINDDYSVNFSVLDNIMKSIKILKNNNIMTALVTSGAIAVGMHELGLSKRPKNMVLKQACAAIGQAKLMEAYNKVALGYGLKTGQILVNHDDFEIRKRMIHLTDTLEAMIKNNVIPIINENDALAVEEIKVGDNDTLAALIAPMLKADLLILFSDIEGLYDKNPKEYKDAKLIQNIEIIDNKVLAMASTNTSSVGTGGMYSKLSAAVIATTSGCNMIICNSSNISNLNCIVNGKQIGTFFKASKKAISSREHWMIFKSKAYGSITIDAGVVGMLEDKKISILPKGIISVDGVFSKGSIIDINDENGNIIAKGISNYSAMEIDIIKNNDSNYISSLLGYEGKEEVIHANNLVKIIKESSYYEWFINKNKKCS